MAERTKIWDLQNFNLFKEVEDQTLTDLADLSQMNYTNKKEVVYFPEEPSNTIYMLISGKIKISRISPDGRSVILALLGAGEIFGESAILGQETHQNIAEVVEDAVVCAIDRKAFLKILEKSNALSRQFRTHLGLRIRKVESQIEDLVFKDAHFRVLNFLLRYMEDFGKQMENLWEVRPFLTHQEIAELTATCRQTVNAILNELKSAGKIDFSPQFLRTPGPESLRQ
ncbi:MAG: Crp/Fnr family transcriptional regulator [Candidatus Marinimicrobia bacterium]|nr:Crp/Fnr family transcriptional regulator [Candidatus Neomarinimicrobiota bacterium]